MDYGTSDEFPYSGALERACARPKQSAFGELVYPTLEAKAAALTDSIIKTHVFVNGNKRTGIMAGMVMLEVNGRTVIAPSEDLTRVALDVESGAMTLKGLTEWMAVERNVAPLTPSEIEDHPQLFHLADLIDPLEE